MLFVFAALADFILFVMHVAAIVIGEPAYLFLRAGKVMAEADARGETWPAILTGAISTVFLAWAIISYWAGTNKPLARWARYLMIGIGIVFLLRGGVIVLQLGGMTQFSDGEAPQMRDFIFSGSALFIGLLHLAAVFKDKPR
ncbi:hypothetical protein [Maritalea porphyrae]|uniref:hypothetical protein n=1 Tax=Maritalea porphyrae TaxID=880732 RepID=UPI0022AFE67D|nr:hypothetical protein [Maritalea porphyrae]MCZ4272426.1 hypothetical protein [Maritalea porphyrae]